MPPLSLSEVPRTILVVGGGGREHALAWALARSPAVQRVVVAPGNGGTAREPHMENVPVRATDVPAVVQLADTVAPDLTVVGPEDPLAAGLVDRLKAGGHLVFGPTQAAARIESSKSWARDFMARHGIPHPHYAHVADVAVGRAAVDQMGGRAVVKADGLAAGKGVVVADTTEEAMDALERMLTRGALGESGRQVVVEERLEGWELSIMAITDGTNYRLLPPAQDHKRLLDGDAGPNTGGMGAFAPTPRATDSLIAHIASTVIEPALAGMRAEGCPFVGCLYAGLMITQTGPVVVEFNGRFGDPETQVQLPLVSSDLAALLCAAARGDVRAAALETEPDTCALTVSLAAAGYPAQSASGDTVHGLDRDHGAVKVFHAGTRAEDGTVVTTGGRTLNVTAWGPSLPDARATAYAAIGPAGIHFEGMQYRTDIGAGA